MRAWGRSILATALVAVLPVALVWALWSLGVVSSLWIAAPLAVALVLLASLAGGEIWKRRAATGDVLFSDLLLWGWVRRLRAERRVDDAVDRLRRPGAQDGTEKLLLLRQLATALDAEDPYLDGHSRRVARYSAAMARRLKVSDEESERIQTAAAVHDVGKLHVPADVLTKPDQLTPEEQRAMRRHAEDGAAMVASLGDPALTGIVRHHHERFDGGGYPTGLHSLEIPLGARIVAVADTFDALTSARPYRPAGTHKRALDVLAAEAGTQLDPAVVRAFVAEYSRRRGLALWALFTLPAAKARHALMPAGFVLGGIVILGALAAVNRTGVTPRPPVRGLSAAVRVRPAGPVTVGRPAAHRSAARHHARAHATAAAGAAGAHAGKGAAAGSRTRLASAAIVVPVASPAPSPAHALPRPAARRAPVRAPRPTTPVRIPPTTPQGTPSASPAPAAPAPAATPAPPAAPAPTTAPTAAPPPPAVTADQCKHGGWVALGYPNQGQCVAGSPH